MTKKKWSRKWLQCQGCGTTERYHHSRGLCWSCYAKEPDQAVRNRRRRAAYYNENPDFRAKCLALSKKHYMKNCDVVLARNKEWHEANRDKAAVYSAKWRQKTKRAEIIGTGIVGHRKGYPYRLDGECVWDVQLDDGSVLEGIPKASLRSVTT